jgi:GNAT superfamily N-acetyltransferase
VTEVRRRDDGLALRALRVGVHPDALVMHVGTDVVVRTPRRPDHRDGNVVDLLVPPNPADVPSRLEGVRRLMEPVGVERAHLRYELPSGTQPEEEETGRVAAFTAAGGVVSDRRVLVLARPSLPARMPTSPQDVTIARLAGPDGDVIDGRRWYAAAVLDRYAHGHDVDTWRAWDEAWGAWQRDRIAALARAHRAEVWLASRHGMPVATLTLVDDLDGLVVVEGIVTHPAHRRRGIARALLVTALTSLRDATTVGRVAVAVLADGPADQLHRDLGFVPVADVRSWMVGPRDGSERRDTAGGAPSGGAGRASR